MLNQTQAQSYSIQPGNFYNWQEEEMYARDAALESFVEDQYAELVSDQRCKVFTRIDDLMTDATTNLYDSPAKSEKFHRLLFALWSGGTDCIRDIRELLETELKALMEDDFNRNHRH